MSIKRDYKPNTTWKARRRVRRQGLAVIALVLVGLFASLLAYVSGNNPQYTKPFTALQPGTTSNQPLAKDDKPEPAPPAKEPKYDFYRVLPERELVIRKDELANKPPPGKSRLPLSEQQMAAVKKPSAATQAQPETRYIIQAGSFRNYADADRLKASIALLGMKARIETATGKNGGRWHRVRLGPVEGKKQADALRGRLQANDIQAIALKAR